MANIPSIKDEDLKAILSEVETELQDFAKSELGLVLSKGFEEGKEGSASPAAEESSEGSSSGEVSSADGSPGSEVSASGEDGSGALEGPPAVSSADAAPVPDGSAPPAAADAGAPGGDGLPPGEEGVVDAAHDHQALTAAMSSLAPEDVMAVYLAAKQCLLDGHGEAAAAGPDQGAPPPGAGSPAPVDAPPPGGSPLAMSEGSPSVCSKCKGSMHKDELHEAPDKKDALIGSKEGEVFTSPDKKDPKGGGANMGSKKSEVGASRPEESASGSGVAIKSEDKMDDLKKAENEDLKAQVELLTKVVEMTLGAPIRKAITKASDLAFVPKGGSASEGVDVSSLSKDEITAKLNAATCDPKLSKADRGLILDFYERNVNLDAVAHLIK